jgi:hypothetical protein
MHRKRALQRLIDPKLHFCQRGRAEVAARDHGRWHPSFFHWTEAGRKISAAAGSVAAGSAGQRGLPTGAVGAMHSTTRIKPL